MDRDATLRQALRNDVEIMMALITVLHREQHDLAVATVALLRGSVEATQRILNEHR